MKISAFFQEIKTRLHTFFQLKKCAYGNHNIVFGKIQITNPAKFKIGSFCRFNDGVLFNSAGGIEIGDDVTISSRCQLLSQGLDIDSWINGERKHKVNNITIGNHVWIGAGAIILPGVSITGHHVVIGAGSVVTKSITDSYCIYAGNPAKIIKKLKQII